MPHTPMPTPVFHPSHFSHYTTCMSTYLLISPPFLFHTYKPMSLSNIFIFIEPTSLPVLHIPHIRRSHVHSFHFHHLQYNTHESFSIAAHFTGSIYTIYPTCPLLHMHIYPPQYPSYPFLNTHQIYSLFTHLTFILSRMWSFVRMFISITFTLHDPILPLSPKPHSPHSEIHSLSKKMHGIFHIQGGQYENSVKTKFWELA